MMKYRNTRTGAVVEVWSEVFGEWEKVGEQPSPATAVKAVKTETKKKAPRKNTKKAGK